MTQEDNSIHKRKDYIDRVFKGDTETRLLGSDGTLEVLKQTIPEGKEWKLYPFSEEGGFEFFYILEGKMAFTEPGPKKILEPGDYINRTGSVNELWFRTIKDSRLIWFASQPVFSSRKDIIESFREKAEKVEELEGMENHSENLENLSVQLGRKLALSSEQIHNLHYAAYFHDIGKSEIPEEILRKEGDLSDEEWKMMRKHPTWGRETLEEKDFLKDPAKIVEQHHERVDGNGYPNGINGNNISIEAKILSVVDAYDAMRTDRSYRNALTSEEAITELNENAGTQFDKEVVDAFLDLISSKEREESASFDVGQAYLEQRKYFLDLGEKVLSKANVEEILPELAQAVVNTSPFQRAIISLYKPSIELNSPEGDARVVHFAFAGLSNEEKGKVKELGQSKPRVNTAKFNENYRISNSYYIPHDVSLDDGSSESTSIASQRSEEEMEDWHPDDKLYVPLTQGEEVMGHISVDDPIDGRTPKEEKLQIIEGLANLGALAITKTQRIKELNEQKENIRTLHNLGQRFVGANTLKQLYRETTELLGNYFDYEYCSVLIKQENKLKSVTHQSKSEEENPLEKGETVQFGEGIIGSVAENREPILANRVREDPRYEEGQGAIKSELAVPIEIDEDLIGVLDIQSKLENNFSEEELELLDIISVQLSIAISNIKRRNKLKEQATKDPLTGVFNRRYFSTTIEKEIERSHRYNHPMGIMMADINNFKIINDRYSHSTGDEVLIEIADILQEVTRDADTVVRYGGDEFLVLFPETGEAVRTVVDRIEARLSNWNESNDLIDKDITLSKGLSFWFPDGGKEIEEVIKQADRRMYRDKENRS